MLDEAINTSAFQEKIRQLAGEYNRNRSPRYNKLDFEATYNHLIGFIVHGRNLPEPPQFMQYFWKTLSPWIYGCRGWLDTTRTMK